ncbi:MAG: S9 family peptidase [bacterium]|nr:S9 family peptidase [bacterium]
MDTTSEAEALDVDQDADRLVAPAAGRVAKKLEIHGDVRVDEFYWLRERENPEVISYLKAENSYTAALMADTETLQEKLFEEMKGRLKEDDASVPYELDGHFYYYRYSEGGEYKLYCRKRGSLETEEEVILDVNELASGHEHVRVNQVQPNPGQDVLSYAIDTVGRRFYKLAFRDLTTGQDLPDVIENVTGNHAWANDGKTVFYTKQHPETLRWYRIYKHVLGTDPSADELVYEETDEEFSAHVWKTNSRRFIMLGSEQTLSSEYRYLDANDPDGEFRVFLPREENHEYSIDDLGDGFLIRTNWNALNFRLMQAPVGSTSKDDWVEVIPHRDDVFVGDVEIFKDFMVVSERKDGLIQMRIVPGDGSGEHYLEFGEPAYDAYFSDNKTFDTQILRYAYTSLTTPDSIFDYDVKTRSKTLRKEDAILGGFDKSNYVTERLWGTARDGVKVPISIVYRRGFTKDGSRPLLLYGYGSYGNSVDAAFRPRRLSLLDRGFAFAIAHVRGGQELGRQWYESGKLFAKMNTFTDFVDCGKFLVSEGYTSPDRMFALGGSAGGLLMGTVANVAPDLFHGIVSHVPFVDVVTTMLDSDIPLTTSEYDEWGNPNEETYYDYMLSYSPYDQLEAKAYPHMLVTTGLHDSQVQYWEPAKYVAKLRRLKTDENLLLLKTNMEAGHSGASGRFKRYRETALDYAFMLRLAGIDD